MNTLLLYLNKGFGWSVQMRKPPFRHERQSKPPAQPSRSILPTSPLVIIDGELYT